ncbi:reverse transcriptase domain-containing protein [Tanacetum coccineum]
MTARITIPEPVPVPAWSDSEVARLLAISSPPASPLSPWSSSPPQNSMRSLAGSILLEFSTITTNPSCSSPTRPDAPPPMPTSAPTSLPPLLLPSASHREDRPEVNLPPRKRLGLALGPRYEVRESSAAAAARPAGGLRADYSFVATMDREIRRDPERYVGYGITDSWDEIVETLQGAPVSTDTELGAHVRDFESMVRRDTYEIYTMLDNEQSQRHYWPDRRSQSYSHDRCRRERFHIARDKPRSNEEIKVRAAARTRQQQIIQTLTVMQTLQREMIPLQGLSPHCRAARAARDALTWWNSHVMTVTHDIAYLMTWVDLKKKMTDKYCPRNEMKKLETELWNLKVIGTDVVKSTRNVNNLNNQKGTGSGQKPTCFECEVQGHFKKECPRMKNNKGNRGNQAGMTGLQRRCMWIGIDAGTIRQRRAGKRLLNKPLCL